MAKQEFWDSIRVARNLFVHSRTQRDRTPSDPQTPSFLDRSPIWLTPKSVKGFNADDFPELGADQRAELTAAVREFSEVANQVPPGEPATPEQLHQATAAFTKILTILPYLPIPREGYQVEEALRKVEFPPWVASWDYKFDDDHYGEPGVWVTVFADEKRPSRQQVDQFVTELAGKIRDAVIASGIKSWPYTRLRTAFEHKTI